MRFRGTPTVCAAVASVRLALAQAAEERPADTACGLRILDVGNCDSHALRFIDPLTWATGHAKHNDGEANVLGGAPWDAITLLS